MERFFVSIERKPHLRVRIAAVGLFSSGNILLVIFLSHVNAVAESIRLLKMSFLYRNSAQCQVYFSGIREENTSHCPLGVLPLVLI